MESSETWRTKALKSFSISKSGMQGGKAKRNLPWSILDGSHVSHFWGTSWSSIYACYMLFRSSGSQKFNSSNGVRFGVEMKELQPLEANHSKLKEEFCTAAKSAFCYEVISQPFLCVCEISQTSFSPAKWSLVLPDICDRHFWIFCFRFLMSKSSFPPCNPPIIGFLSY